MPKWHFLFEYQKDVVYDVFMSIKSARKRKGYSQDDISKIFDIPLRTLKRYESLEKSDRNFRQKMLENQIKNLDSKKKKSFRLKESISIVGSTENCYILAHLLSESNDVMLVDKDGISEKSVKFPDIKCSKNLNNFSFVNYIIFNQKNSSKIEGFFEYFSYLKNHDLHPVVVVMSPLSSGAIFELSEKFQHLEIIYCPIQQNIRNMYQCIAKTSHIFLGVNRISLKSKKIAKILENIFVNKVGVSFVSYKEADLLNSYMENVESLKISTIQSIESLEDPEIQKEKIINLIK